MSSNNQRVDAEHVYQKGDFQAAKRQYLIVLQANRDPFIYLRVAQCHFALKEYSDAETICRTAIELSPNFADLHLLLGKVFYQQDQLLKAEEEAIKAIELDDTLSSAYTLLAATRLMQKNYPEAIVNAEMAIELDASAWISHFILGSALGNGIDHKRAVRELKTAFELNPTLKNGIVILLQFALKYRIWVSILLLLLVVSALLMGNIILVAFISILYFALGLISLTARKTLLGMFLILVGIFIFKLYFFFW